jgi:hypothetical protein
MPVLAWSISFSASSPSSAAAAGALASARLARNRTVAANRNAARHVLAAILKLIPTAGGHSLEKKNTEYCKFHIIFVLTASLKTLLL